MAHLVFALPFFMSLVPGGCLEPFWRVLLSDGWLPVKKCKVKQKAGDSMARTQSSVNTTKII